MFMLDFFKKRIIMNVLLYERCVTMTKRICLLLLVLTIAGCGSYYEPEPVGVGKDVNELKLSPCACMEVELDKTLPDWFVAMI